MSKASQTCREENRREDVRVASLLGLDYVEVSDDQRTLYVYFLGKAPAKIEKANLSLAGGRRVRDVQIVDMRVLRQADPTLDDYLEVLVNKPGDFSTYTLSAVEVDEQGRPTGNPMAGFDSRYGEVCFSFKASCPTDLDCKSQPVCPPASRTQPHINYLAKDYESFRQLMLDRLALIMPAWNENHAADVGITLVELLAYVGDYLSYYQDAVATEAYLGTARERISVRRHARLVDYAMHEGCNARAWLTVDTDTDQTLDPTQIYFVTSFPGAPASHILTALDLVNVPSSSYEVFQALPTSPDVAIAFYAAHSEIYFYTWGDCECCLAPGATSATLIDQWITTSPPVADAPAPKSGTPAASAGGTSPTKTPAAVVSRSDTAPAGPRALQNLKVGDILIFEEVCGPHTGILEDADPTHRQAVRLTKVTSGVDPLYHPDGSDLGQPIVEIEWSSEDALTFALCISSQAPPPDCGCLKNVSVARGNVILVDNGGDTTEEIGTVPTQSTTPQCPSCCEPAAIEILPAQFCPVLTQEPLTFSQPLPPPCSAAALITQDARQALPWISLQSIPPGPPCSANAQGEGANGSASQPPCAVLSLFSFADIDDPRGLAAELKSQSDPAAQLLLSRLSAATRQLLTAWDGSSPLPSTLAGSLVADLESLLEVWSPVSDLLESGPDDRSFVVEVDNNGYAHVRFGDGLLGRQPEAGTAFRAQYRVGNGQPGNVGAETITDIVFRDEKVDGVKLVPRNPLSATGGADPEPIQDVKLYAPYSFGSVLERAITADDYATIAGDNPRRLLARAVLEQADPAICADTFVNLQRAKAVLRWTGSWYTVMVALDPEGAEDADRELIEEIELYLHPFRRMGYDLVVAPAQYVALKISLSVCVLPNYLRGHVEAAVLAALGNGVLPDGTLGFFHPDNLSFGDGIYVSRLIAAVQSVPGVQSVSLTELERFESSEASTADDSDELPLNSVLALGPLEIARLDNDPNFPENGRLILTMRGGR